jgi:hypothetical protein
MEAPVSVHLPDLLNNKTIHNKKIPMGFIIIFGAYFAIERI